MVKLILTFNRTGDYSSTLAPSWSMQFYVNGVMFYNDVSYQAAGEMLNKQVEKSFHSGDNFICYTFTPDTSEPMTAERGSEHDNVPELMKNAVDAIAESLGGEKIASPGFGYSDMA
jgi:hypothetical protein